MISAMPAVAVRRGRKKSFGRFNQPPPSSHHSSTASLAARIRSQRLGNATRPFRPIRRRFDTEVDQQRRRFLIYTGTLFLISGLFLVFIGVGTSVPAAQTVGLLLIGIGALLCILKVFCSEARAAVPTTPAKIEVVPKEPEFTELPVVVEAASTEPAPAPPTAQTPAVSPPNSIPETQVLIERDSGARE